MPPISAGSPSPCRAPAGRAGDVRFERIRLASKEAGGGRRCGHLAACKGDSGVLLWRVRVDDVDGDRAVRVRP